MQIYFPPPTISLLINMLGLTSLLVWSVVTGNISHLEAPDAEKKTPSPRTEPEARPTTTAIPRARCDLWHFECSSGQCVDLYKRCNDLRDCWDGSDETGCLRNQSCPGDKFNCFDSIGTCLTKSFVCDGRNDCSNSKDEENCTKAFSCPVDYAKCRNQHCVHKRFLCDGLDDCGDGTDEANCAASVAMPCPSDKYQCKLGPCIRKDLRCDGFRDCPQSDDESGCPAPSGLLENAPPMGRCGVDMFRCVVDSLCIPNDWRCDGDNDCADSSDERHCWQLSTTSRRMRRVTSPPQSGGAARRRSTSQPCKADQFKCSSGRCIDETRVCDGVRDCSDASDEGRFCSACDRSNGGCQHYCRPNAKGVQCSCRYGYELEMDGSSCRDPTECAAGHKCDHFCAVTSPGRFMCYCALGYERVGRNGARCRLRLSDGYLIFSAGKNVRTVEPDSYAQLYGTMFETKGSIFAVDYNPKQHSIAYISEERIWYADSKGQTTCVLGGFGKGMNIAIDWVTENLYYAETQPARLGFCESKGRYCHEFFWNDLDQVHGLVLHPRRGLMFWADWGQKPKIERAGMDGSSRTVIIDYKISLPVSLAMDYVREELYWGDNDLHVIERTDLNGLRRETLLSKPALHPIDMAVFLGRVFWADLSSSAIYSAETSTINPNITLLHSTVPQPNAITFNHSLYHNTSLPNPCAALNCPFMCALVPPGDISLASETENPVSARCLCPRGYESVGKTNEKECMFFAAQNLPGVHWCVRSFRKACATHLLGGAGQIASPCANNGTCSREIYDNATKSYRINCICAPGFSGIYCELNEHEQKRRWLAHFASQSDESSSAAGAILLTLFIFCFALLLIYLIKRYDVTELTKYAARVPNYILIRRRRASQREQMLRHHDSVRSVDSDARSFSNPVYDDPNKSPIHLMTTYKSRPTNTMNDSGNGSGVSY